MHICFIGEIATDLVKTGGIGSFVANIIPELIQKGCTISVISFKKQELAVETEQTDGYLIHWINTHQWGPLRFYKRISDTNRVLNIIHKRNPIHFIETSESGLFLIKRLIGVKFIIRLHGGHVFFANSTTDTPFSRKKAWMEKLSLRKANAIIGVSKYVLNTTAASYPFIWQKPNTVIHNPIVLSRFCPSNQSKMTPGSILFLGSLTEKKGIRQLIEAMPVVNQKTSGTWLHVYGRDIAMRPSGRSFKELLDENIERLGLKNVTIHQPVPNHEMPAIIESAAMVVLPSHMEAMPLAWLEAMAMEKIVIAGSPGPGPEVIAHMKNGLLCDPFEPADIAEKICYVLEHPNEATAMAIQARKDIVAGFDSSYLADQNFSFFKSLK